VALTVRQQEAPAMLQFVIILAALIQQVFWLALFKIKFDFYGRDAK